MQKQQIVNFKLCLILGNETLHIKAVWGSSAILKCALSEKQHKLEMMVHWRYNDSLNVCDMTEGKCSGEHQDPKYKNRTETFPQESVKGNFSLQLNNLTYSDSGEYRCYIPDSQVVIVHLLVIGV